MEEVSLFGRSHTKTKLTTATTMNDIISVSEDEVKAIRDQLDCSMSEAHTTAQSNKAIHIVKTAYNLPEEIKLVLLWLIDRA